MCCAGHAKPAKSVIKQPWLLYGEAAARLNFAAQTHAHMRAHADDQSTCWRERDCRCAVLTHLNDTVAFSSPLTRAIEIPDTGHLPNLRLWGIRGTDERPWTTRSRLCISLLPALVSPYIATLCRKGNILITLASLSLIIHLHVRTKQRRTTV